MFFDTCVVVNHLTKYIEKCTSRKKSLMMLTNVLYIASFIGDLYHGERRSRGTVITFTIRVYPFMDCELRTQEKCTYIVEELTTRLNQVNNNANRIKKKVATKQKKKKKKKEKCIDLYGHLGKMFVCQTT